MAEAQKALSNVSGSPLEKVVPIRPASPFTWRGAEYPRIEPGRYLVCGLKHQGPDWVRAFRRWSIRIEFTFAHEPGSASAFFNMGSDPLGPRIGRQSKYFKAWTLANGELPRKGQEMTPDVFFDGQLFTVSIEDARYDGEGNAKSDAEIYSRITAFHEVQRV